MCKKIERELHDKKRAMASVIDVTNIAYEARDQARAAALSCAECRLNINIFLPVFQAMNEIAALRAQSDKEQSAFDAEFRSVRTTQRLASS